MYRNPQLPSLTRRLGISITVGLVIALIGGAVEAAIGSHPLLSFESIDDVIIGVLTAVVIFVYEQHRYRVIMDKIRTISAMNHHVRNALQTISYSPYTEQEKQIRMIAESVSRIEWALREVLPGEAATGNNSSSAADGDALTPPATNNEMAAGSR
jgi:hypothetical protein